MRLRSISIAGADDATDRLEFQAFAKEYPFLIWALLASSSRWGSPRYPTVEKMLELLEGLPWKQISVHLCGKLAREALAGAGPPPACGLYQINGFSDWVRGGGSLAGFRRWLRLCERKETVVILQVSSKEALEAAGELRARHDNVLPLWDQSGGTGQVKRWPETPVIECAYSGGITPENIVEHCEWITKEGHPEDDTLLDLESGVRTEDRLDFEKVRLVLERARPFIVGAG